MTHVTLDDLARNLKNAATSVRVHGHYAHYKHPDQPYEVKGFTILEATDEVAVRYTPLSNPGIEFTRPLDSWLETVEVNGKSVPRFAPVE